MTKWKVYFSTTVEQSVEIEGDFEEDYEVEEAAFDKLKQVPFIGWEFDSSGDWVFEGADKPND